MIDLLDMFLKNILLVFSAINFLEDLLSKRTDVLVTVSEKVLHTFRIRPKICAVIMNFSEDYKLDKYKSEDGILTLVYTGLICEDQGLERVTDAIKNLKGVRTCSCW